MWSGFEGYLPDIGSATKVSKHREGEGLRVYLCGMKQAGIKIFAPASISNLACGFDILGMALEALGDEVTAWLSDTPGVRLESVTGDQGRLPREADRNAVTIAARALLEHLGEEKRGVVIGLHKLMPFSSGLGSSGSSAVAGAMAVNELLRRPLEKRELLPFAMRGEFAVTGGWFVDNVAASLMGGLVLVRDGESLDVLRLPVPKGIYAAVVHPHIELPTREVRSILQPHVALKDMVIQTGNLAGLIQGLYQSDFPLIRRSLKDVVIEPQRAPAIPGFQAMQEAAMLAGALGCSISGSGPSVFALFENSLEAENGGEAMMRVLQDIKQEATLYLSRVNMDGALKY